MNGLTIGDECWVYTGRGWKKGLVKAIGGPPPTAWITYQLGQSDKMVRVSDPRHLRPGKKKRPEVTPPAAVEQSSLL